MKKALIFVVGIITLFDLGWATWMISGYGTDMPTIQHYQSTLTYIDFQLTKMTLRQRIASLLILHKSGTDAADLSEYLTTYQPGGLIFMGDNIPETSDQLSQLTSELQTNKTLPYLFAVDEEGGVVTRLSDDVFPSALDLKNQSPDVTSSAFVNRSKLLNQVGLNLNFGIVADITGDTNSFIYDRVFGSNPLSVASHITAAVKASTGLTLSTIKHFPGHGETASDSHYTIPTSDISFEQWQLQDKPPFLSGIQAGADVVMFGHLCFTAVDDLPASLSSKWHDILKNEFHFNGLTITDDMGMLQNLKDEQYANPIDNAVRALQAGNNMLIYVLGSDNSVAGVGIDDIIDGIVDAVNDGKISRSLINQNARKVISVRRSVVNY